MYSSTMLKIRTLCIICCRFIHIVANGRISFFLFFILFYFIFKLHKIVLVMANIIMNPPQVYMCSPSWTLLPPPPHTIPLDCPSALAPSIQYCASNLDWQLVSYMIVYMFQCHSPKSSHPLPLTGCHFCHCCMFVDWVLFLVICWFFN